MNAYFVERPLGAFGAMSDEEAAEAMRSVDPNDSAAVKRLITAALKPEFDRLDDASQELIRENYRYFLTAGLSYWDKVYEMSQPPIDPPDDPRQFFVWVWEVLFPGQSYHMDDVSDVVVDNDFEALRVLRARTMGDQKSP